MTLNQLYKQIGKLLAEDKNRGRRPVLVAKDTFTHNCEGDGQTILPVDKLVMDAILVGDPDGGTMTNKDGSERYQRAAILVGWSYNPSPGPLESHYSPLRSGE